MNNKHVLTGFAAVLLLLATLPVRADPLDVKLGLWEMTYTAQMSGELLPDSVLMKMSPEQRARVEAALGQRQGQAPQTHTHQSCLTQERLNHAFDDKQGESPDQKCTHTILTATHTVQEYKIQCTGSAPRSGVLRFEALSRERVKGTFKMNLPNGAVNSRLSGRWLSADCGKIH